MLYQLHKVSRFWGKSFFSILILLNLIVLVWVIRGQEDDSNRLPKATAQDSLSKASSQVFEYTLPESLDFAGEKVPLDQTLVRERLDEVLVATLYRHANTILRYKRAARWFPEIERILKKNKIPDDFKYLAVVESNLQNLVSVKGATGFWQFMPETAQEKGLEVSAQVDERYHPIKSTEAAAKYLLQAHRIFKNWTLVAASYNMGMRGLKNQLDQQKVDSFYELYLNAETAAYIYHILAIKCIFENPDQYGYPIEEKDRYQPINFKELTIQTSIPDLVAFAQEQKINYDILKVYNPWLRSKSLLITQNTKNYVILIPKNLHNSGN